MSSRRTTQQPTLDLKLVHGERDSGQLSTAGQPGLEFDPRMAADIVADFANISDPLDAEVVGSMFLASIELLGEHVEDAMIEHFLPTFEAVADPAAAGMLAVLGMFGGQRVGAAATAGLQRLRELRIQVPAWVEKLSAPVTAHDCVAFHTPEGEPLVLAARFARAAGAHSVVVLLDPEHCGEANDILLLDADEHAEALLGVQHAARCDGIQLIETALDPAEFRWHTEIAMGVRNDHDEETGPENLIGELDIDDDGPGYRVLAPLLRARLHSLPISDKPKPHHAPDPDLTDLIATFEQLATAGVRNSRFGWGGRTPKPLKLPPKRKTKDGAAPILRLRVDLQGAKPPIWRRLEVPGDIPLATLHQVLQVAFAWDDYHLYSFDTDYGSFGRPDPELEHRSDKNVTLEQVAAAPGAKLTYTYDFGDNWEHRIRIEKSLRPEPGADYPRCTGGRRAAPPEDCGGIWGYQELVDILADPDSEEHDERLEWLGLDQAADFDPTAFDMHRITESLAALQPKARKRR